ncbi:PIG-L deacetylase family protein [Geoalkalibacter halelectricus]|uniref:PIG-L family deacetylase n=1 Tax=Geoalkalibacter halelectricus TaxID=2847045 RepID=A0ABY5ZQR9_9BACT|nr:PIG-L deacetylase family protein [Geoalkalibacter halelectricus]MDO3377972.1 PIG-L family deacetylase [Geoalkalibacter halelectricus]UWZ81525.1 PIG-L family deacetylase [Geoalkalibacter halelectricus]
MAVILVVAAHPDDEVLGCGGTIARHAAAGDEVHILFLADGESSRCSTANPAAIEARLAKARAAADILGVKEIHALGLPDNRLDCLPLLDIIQPVERLMAKLQPEMVYTHHHGDLNIDHRLAHQAVMTACRPVPGQKVKEIRCFEVPSSTEWQTPGAAPFIPNLFIDISAVLARKNQALAVYRDELRSFPHSRSLEAIEALERWRGAGVGMEHAESFIIVRKLSF